MKRLTALALAALVALAACTGSDQGAENIPRDPVTDPVIAIADMEFENGTITIEEGTTVTWVWEDAPMEHNVVFDSFESPLQAEGTYTQTFDEVGEYEYHCSPHPFMTGTITVIEASDD